MQRHRGNLDQEPEEYRSGDGDLGRARESSARVQRLHRVAPGEDTEGEETCEHHRGAEEGVDKEPDGRLAPVLVAPDPHQQVHWDQRYLEEDVEHDQVLRSEYPEHPELRDEEDREVLFEVLPHVPRSDDGYEGQERREVEHPEAQTVETDPVAHVEGLDPRYVLRERRRVEVVPEGEVDVRREQERHGGNAQSRVTYQARLVRQEQHQDRAEQRDEDRYRGDHSLDPTAKAVMVASTIRANTRNAYCAPTMIPMIRTLSRMKSA